MPLLYLHFSVITGFLDAGLVVVLGLGGKSSKTGNPQGSILELPFSLLCIYDFLMMVTVIMLSTLMLPIFTQSLSVIRLICGHSLG